jgi:hypothetical protein
MAKICNRRAGDATANHHDRAPVPRHSGAVARAGQPNRRCVPGGRAGAFYRAAVAPGGTLLRTQLRA